MNDTTAGFLFLLLAGAMNGSFTLPMKFTARWAWENTWLAWTIFALGIFPPAVTLATIPNLGQIYSQTGSGIVFTVAAFGAGWGVSQIFFGLAVDAIGIALAFSVILGISAAVGSLVPLLRLHPEKILSAGGLGVIAGVALVILGVGVCAVAGRRREAAVGAGPAAGKTSVGRGLLFCVFSGLGSALVNFGLAFGGPLLRAAEASGVSSTWSPNAVWMPLMMAGGIPNLAYTIFLMRKNKTGGRFGHAGTASHWWLAAAMAFLWFASTLLYGMASGRLGEWGPILGWPMFMSLIVITASLWGVVTGEWKNAGKRPLQIQMAGVAVLILSVFVLTAASRKI